MNVRPEIGRHGSLLNCLRQIRRVRRDGLTLLEIVLALAIAAVAMSLLAQLVSIGARSAAASRDQTKAQLVAESIMAEYASGVMLPQAAQGTWEMDPLWTYDAQVATGLTDTLYVITVTATHDVESTNPATFSLTQWLAIPPEPEEEESADSSTSGGEA